MTETPSRGAVVAEDLGWTLGLLLRVYRERVGPAVADFPHGARGYQTLCEVVRGSQPSQLALANRLGIDRTVMTYLIDDLVEAGLVERRPNPDDRRQRQVVATDRGRTLVADACERVSRAESDLLGALDESERQRLRQLLAKAACAHGGSVRVDDPCEVVGGDLDG